MAKKSFKDNPALQFISAAGGEAQPDTGYTQNTDSVHPMNNTYNAHNTQDAHTMQDASVPRAADVPERKSKRLNLLIRPSLLGDIAKIAHMNRMSVNDLINTVLSEYREAHAEQMAEYDRVFGGEG